MRTHGFELLDLPDFDAGICAQTDPELFFPQSGRNMQQARTLCMGCACIEECRRWGDQVERGLHSYDIYGMLAGEAPAERAARREQVAA